MSTFSALLSTPRPTEKRIGEEQALGLPEADGDTRLYRGRSIDELIPRIEAELGVDAIVVRRRRGLEGGIGGFFRRPFVEVEARPGGPSIDIYDEDPEPTRVPAQAPPMRHPLGAYMTNTLATIAATAPEATVEDPPRPTAGPVEEFRELTPDTFGAALAAAEQAHPLPAAPQASPAPSPRLDPLEGELERIDRDMGELHVTRPQVVRPRQVTRQSPPALAPRWEQARADIERNMVGVGVSEELTRELVDSAIVHAIPFAPLGGLERAVRGALAARIPVTPLLSAQGATIAVVGPGGAGKTNCCAALLGAYRRAGTLPASCATIMLESERQQPAMLLSPHVMEPAAIASQRARDALEERTLRWPAAARHPRPLPRGSSGDRADRRAAG